MANLYPPGAHRKPQPGSTEVQVRVTATNTCGPVDVPRDVARGVHPRTSELAILRLFRISVSLLNYST